MFRHVSRNALICVNNETKIIIFCLKKFSRRHSFSCLLFFCRFSRVDLTKRANLAFLLSAFAQRYSLSTYICSCQEDSVELKRVYIIALSAQKRDFLSSNKSFLLTPLMSFRFQSQYLLLAPSCIILCTR